MQQGDVALREGAGTLYRPATGVLRKEMPWPLTAGVLLVLLLQLPTQLTVAATPERGQCPAPPGAATTPAAADLLPISVQRLLVGGAFPQHQLTDEGEQPQPQRARMHMADALLPRRRQRRWTGWVVMESGRDALLQGRRAAGPCEIDPEAGVEQQGHQAIS